MLLAIMRIRSLLKSFLEEADLPVSCLLDRTSVRDSRQSGLPGHKNGAAESNERKEPKTSLRNVVSPERPCLVMDEPFHKDALSKPASCPGEPAFVHL